MNSVYESIKNCIESYAPEHHGKVIDLLREYADGLRNGNLDENKLRSKGMELKAQAQKKS